jgi:hypothetical protein
VRVKEGDERGGKEGWRGRNAQKMVCREVWWMGYGTR